MPTSARDSASLSSTCRATLRAASLRALEPAWSPARKASTPSAYRASARALDGAPSAPRAVASNRRPPTMSPLENHCRQLSAASRQAASPSPRSARARTSASSSARAASSGVIALVGRDVLIRPEEVVRIPLTLQRLQPVVLVGAVCGPDPGLALFSVRHEVDVGRGLVPLDRGPEVAHPLAFFVEAFGVLGAAADVVRDAGVAPAEHAVVHADARDRTAHLPDGERRQRRLDARRVVDGDVDHLVGQLRRVEAAEVVPAVRHEAG